jgi:hypothetical protein
MVIKNVFMTATAPDSLLDGSGGTQGKAQVSDFLTVQSFANFAAMTGAITAAWDGLQRLTPYASTLWVPYGCALAWAVISVMISLDGLRKSSPPRLDLGTLLQAIFLGLINSLVLAGAVVGTNIVAR